MATAPCCHCCPSRVEDVEEEASMGMGSRTVGRFRVRLFWGSKHACPKLRSLLVPGPLRFNKKSILRYGGKWMRSPAKKTQSSELVSSFGEQVPRAPVRTWRAIEGSEMEMSSHLGKAVKTPGQSSPQRRWDPSHL